MTDPGSMLAAVSGAVSEAMGGLVDAVVATRPAAASRQLLGTVTSVSPFRVAISGESVGVLLPVIGSYAPTVGDLVVVVERAKGDLYVAGAVGESRAGSYTPTLYDMAIGAVGALNTATYTFAAGVLHVAGEIVWGTSGTRVYPTATSGIGLPPGFTADPWFGAPDDVVGACGFRVSGGYSGLVWLGHPQRLRPLLQNVSAGGAIAALSPTATQPGSWSGTTNPKIVWRATVLGAFAP